jgi:hypothetical protein
LCDYLLAYSGRFDDATFDMKPQSQPSTHEVLAGLVERVTYHNGDNGFCVLRIKARGHRDLVTVIGHAAVISAGEWVTASGEWTNDRTHGQQHRAKFLRTSEPTSLDGIEKYLGSGMIRGIGPVYAKKLVRAFGEKVFDTIEAEPERLREVSGIGSVQASRITAAWVEQKIVREIMVFLHNHGVGTARAVRIYKTYGADAVQVMSENPYAAMQPFFASARYVNYLGDDEIGESVAAAYGPNCGRLRQVKTKYDPKNFCRGRRGNTVPPAPLSARVADRALLESQNWLTLRSHHNQFVTAPISSPGDHARRLKSSGNNGRLGEAGYPEPAQLSGPGAKPQKRASQAARISKIPQSCPAFRPPPSP